MTKEAYAIYLSVKKLAFYITDADITLRSNHLPLRRFLQKNTLNDKVNNWAVELKCTGSSLYTSRANQMY